MLFLSASACQTVHGSFLCCSHQSRILSFSFTHSTTENTKLHWHISLGKDIFILMHKQALTQHPRREKAKDYVQRCSHAQSSVLTQTALSWIQIDKHLFVQGELVSTNLWDGAVWSALQTGMAAVTSPFLPSTCSVQSHIVLSKLPTTSSLQFLPHLLLLGICLLPVFWAALFPSPSPWLLFVASCILHTKFISHPLLCFSRPILHCMIVSTMLFPLNPMWNSSSFLATCLFLHSNSSCPLAPLGEMPWASSVQLLPSSPEGIHWLSHLALPCDFCSST